MSDIYGAEGPSRALGNAETGQAEPAQSEVGLAQNAEGIAFQCGTCEYFSNQVCHNKHPDLSGRRVEPTWCCNLYDHEGMKVIV